MASKQVAARKKSSTFVGAAATSHAEVFQKASEEFLSPHLKKGEKLPDLALVGVLMGRALEASTTAMEKADDAHEMEMADDVAPRDARDQGVQALYGKVVDDAEIILGLYGAKAVKAVGLDGTTPRDPVLLVRYATAASNLLRSYDFGKSRVKGATLSGKAIAGEIDELIETVQASLNDVAREAREGEVTLVKKRGAMTSFDKVFSRTATMISALLAFGGEDELASRVRPSTRKPGQAAGEETDEGDDKGEEPKPA